MLFNSFEFIFAFLPIALFGTFLLARVAPGAAQLWLIAASLFFYTYWNPRYLPLLLISILFNYTIAIMMVRAGDDDKYRKLLLALAVIVNLGLLGYYKYSDFFVTSLTALTGWQYEMAAILLPLGISFYTFQQLTLLIDISAGAGGRVRLQDFALFVTFFPHLIAGPIVHHREMMPQFEKASWRFDWSNIGVGLSLFAMGLFKKAVLADGIAHSISPLYAQADAGQHPTLIYAWAAAIGFMLQLYFDFSGYSEMALGLARMVGIKLPMNFNSPLKATSVIEFWSRWHITLTRFLTAYLYNPITMGRTRRRMMAKRKGIQGARTTRAAFLSLIAVPTMATMFLSGLWHGAGLQFLVWGTLHGVYLVINHAWRFLRPRIWSDTPAYERRTKPFAWALTFAAVVSVIPFFHANTMSAAWRIIAGMFGYNGVALPQTVANRSAGLAAALDHVGVRFVDEGFVEFLTTWGWIAGLMAIILLLPNVLEVTREAEPAITMPGAFVTGRLRPLGALEQRLLWRPTTGWAVITAILAAAAILSLTQVSEFIYWQF